MECTRRAVLTIGSSIAIIAGCFEPHEDTRTGSDADTTDISAKTDKYQLGYGGLPTPADNSSDDTSDDDSEQQHPDQC